MFWRNKRKQLESRVFLSPGHMDVFMRGAAHAKIEGIVRQISRIKQAIVSLDDDEVRRRKKFLDLYGVRMPKTLTECDQLISDLRSWRDI